MKPFHEDRRRFDHLLEQTPEPLSKPRKLYESGMSVVQVAEALGCDRRTAAKLIRENREMEEIGKWDSSHKKISAFLPDIDAFLKSNMKDQRSLHSLSQAVYMHVSEKGYEGSERTIRNHLSRREEVILFFTETKGEERTFDVRDYKYRESDGYHHSRRLR